MDWISVSDQLPAAKQRVYVCVLGEGKKTPFQTMAEFISKRSVMFEDYCNDENWPDGGDYDEDIDDYWTPEGWYEWQSEPEINWMLGGRVTHWMPLLDLPIII